VSYAALTSAQRARAAVDGVLPGLVLGLGVAPVLAANGGYFPSSWGWAGVGLAWAAVLAAALSDFARPTRMQLAFVGLLVAFTGWIALSLIWTSTQSQTGLEFDHMLVYVAGAVAVVAIVGAERVARLLAGVATGIALISAYALATRLFPHGAAGDTFAGSRLATPIGYWNGLAIVTGMGIILALVFAARASNGAWRAVATGVLPLLVTTVYFTFSRGGWLALLVGLAVLFAADRDRLQLLGPALIGAIASLFAVWRASQASALTHTSAASVTTAAHQGRSLAAVVAGACLVAAYAGWGVRRFDGIWQEPQVQRVVRIAAVALAAIVVVGGVARYGAPWSIARHGYDSFVAEPSGQQANLNSRLFSLTNNGRLPAWKVAWHAFEDHPLGGIGAGGFENYWNQHRTFDEKIRNAHNLYVETLADEGIVGLVLLIGMFSVPLLAFRRVRSNPLAAGALAAFTMFLAHAIVDWDWQLSGVTLCALFCGGALLAMSRDDIPAGQWRWPVLALGSVVGLLALANLSGQLLLHASDDATRSSDWGRAISDAKHAHWVLPYSSEPYERLAAAQLGQHERDAGIASFKNAIAKSPGDYTLWVDLAKTQSGSDRYASFATALKLNPLGADDIRTIVMQLLNPLPGASGS
jgi:hypothetical protein